MQIKHFDNFYLVMNKIWSQETGSMSESTV